MLDTKRNIFYDILCMIMISIPSLVYIVPWILSIDPSLGIDHYGGDSILINKTFGEINKGYITDWYIGANFVLYPVRYLYWITLQILSVAGSNPITIIKLSFLLTFFLSIITSYAVIKKIYRKRIYGIIGSLIYVYVPYHMAWVGTEAMWSLSLYYAILPVAFYYFLEFITELNVENKIDNTKLLISSLFLSLIMFMHPQSFLVLTLPFLSIFSVIYIIFSKHSIFVDKSINKLEMKIFPFIKHISLSFLPIIITFLIGAFWWTTAISHKDIVSEPANSMNIVKGKTSSFISIITLQGRAWTFPTFEHFFNSNIEITIAVILAIIIWVPILYILYNWKDVNKNKNMYINENNKNMYKNMYWIPSIIISSMIFILMAMGPFSPIPIYTWLYYNIPFFSNLRTPDRWLSIVILCVSLIFPLGIEIVTEKVINRFSKIRKIIPNITYTKHIIYMLIVILILANSWTELSYTFKDFKLNGDIYQYYDLLSSKQDNSKIFTIPPYELYKLDKTRNNIDDDRKPYIRDPRLWTFMYGKKDNFDGGSESLSVKELEEFSSEIRSFSRKYIVNVGTISDVYGMNYLWIDKTKKESSQYIMNNSTVKLLETKNYSIYQNIDPFPRIFAVKEDDIELDSKWEMKDRNLKLLNSSNNSFESLIKFSDNGVRELYIRYKELINIEELDELYGEYTIKNVNHPELIELNFRFTDENGRYIWIKKLEESNGYFKIPAFWFQLKNKDGKQLEFDNKKLFEIGIISSDKSNNGIIDVKNLKLLKHKLVNLTYYDKEYKKYKIDKIDIPKISGHSKLVVVYNYAYNPDIKLKLNDNFIDSYKIFGFLNGFDIPFNNKALQGTIEHRPGRSFYIGIIISLMTIISLIGIVLYGKIQKNE